MFPIFLASLIKLVKETNITCNKQYTYISYCLTWGNVFSQARLRNCYMPKLGLQLGIFPMIDKRVNDSPVEGPWLKT